PRDLSLVEPVEEAWIVASIAVGYDEARDRILVVANELLEEEEGGGDPASARVLITRAQAAAFVKQAEALMKAGRQICPWCSQPKDPGGHTCPRSNGHVHHGDVGPPDPRRSHPEGPDALGLQCHVPRRALPRRRDHPGGVQAGARRAAAVGFPARALQARAGGLASLRGVRLGHRADDD